VKNVGKPYAGKPHVRFDEEGLGSPALYSTELDAQDYREFLVAESSNCTFLLSFEIPSEMYGNV